jgi:hypothetical protein
MLFELASTSRIPHVGQRACTACTSREISSAQPPSTRGYVEPPDWLTLRKQPTLLAPVQAGSEGIPKAAL